MATEEPDDGAWISSVRREPPDYSKLGRAFLTLAMREAAAEAEAQAQAEQTIRAEEAEHDSSTTEDTT